MIGEKVNWGGRIARGAILLPESGKFIWFFFHIRNPERRAIDRDGNTMVFEAIQEGLYKGLTFEEVIPFRVVEIGGNNGRFFPISFTHQLEEGIDLLRFEG